MMNPGRSILLGKGFVTMQLELQKKDSILLVKLSGELDHHCADEIRRRIDRELMSVPIRHVVFDCAKLSFMDSSGIGMLMGRYRVIKYLGGDAWIAAPNAAIRKILDMGGVFPLFGFGEESKALVDSLMADALQSGKAGVLS